MNGFGSECCFHELFFAPAAIDGSKESAAGNQLIPGRFHMLQDRSDDEVKAVAGDDDGAGGVVGDRLSKLSILIGLGQNTGTARPKQPCPGKQSCN
ncbi:MAG: hypothetical protein HC857_05030 [Synechococcales cyanobacterium RU_4_20]|nr:hypothetical protein [Synechococcales cyanobacterium RU_4_20]